MVAAMKRLHNESWRVLLARTGSLHPLGCGGFPASLTFMCFFPLAANSVA